MDTDVQRMVDAMPETWKKDLREMAQRLRENGAMITDEDAISGYAMWLLAHPPSVDTHRRDAGGQDKG